MSQRPLSPFMIGPYYRPQLTSVLSITHRLTGILLSVAGAPLLLAWLAALAGGPEGYAAFTSACAGIMGMLAAAALSFSLWFHFFNGLRHLVWDTGRMLDLRAAYRSGWAVVALTIAATAATLAVLR